MTQRLDRPFMSSTRRTDGLAFLQVGPVETLGTTPFWPRAAVCLVAIFRRPSIQKHLTLPTSNSLELIALLLVAEDARRPQNSPLRQACITWFPRYHTLRPRELLLDEKMPQSSEEYAKYMVWYRTTFILLYEPAPDTSPSTNTKVRKFRATLAR
jgi:hypothetical protein